MKERLLLLLENAKAGFSRIMREESGQDLVEYSLLLMLVSLVAIATVDRLGDLLYYTFYRISHTVASGGRHFDYYR
jgi:Flp pilus assembly pilin Flp